MTARHRAGGKLAATEAHEGSVPELRQLARQLLADQQDQIAKMTRWTPDPEQCHRPVALIANPHGWVADEHDPFLLHQAAPPCSGRYRRVARMRQR
jgi:Domain of unknown function (DUF305)